MQSDMEGLNNLAKGVIDTRPAAIQAISRMDIQQINSIVEHITMMFDLEIMRCATYDDYNFVRKSQGSVAALSAVMALFDQTVRKKSRPLKSV